MPDETVNRPPGTRGNGFQGESRTPVSFPKEGMRPSRPAPLLILKVLFGGIFVFMVGMTMIVSLRSNLFEVLPAMLSHPWTVATLWDAYLAFLTFYVWVAYKESRAWTRILWFVLIMGLGNIAISFYMLVQLFRLPKDAPVEALLLRS